MNFKYLITDGAPYCLKVGKALKTEFPDLQHIVCLCHNLHLVAEDIRKTNVKGNKFVSLLKRSLIK